MSSSIDQRSAASGHDHGVANHQSNEMEYPAYMGPTGDMTVEGGGYSQVGSAGQMTDSYGAYYQPFMFPAGSLMADSGGVWSSDPATLQYGNGYGNDYMPYGAAGLGGQYEYPGMGWFPATYSQGATWEPNVMTMQQHGKAGGIPTHDYISNGYYDNMQGVATVGIEGGAVMGYGATTVSVDNVDQNGSVQSVEHSFKGMRVSGDNDGDAVSNGGYVAPSRSTASGSVGAGGGSTGTSASSSGSGASSQKKSWATVASQPAKVILQRPKPAAGVLQPPVQTFITAVKQQQAPAAWTNNNGGARNGAPRNDGGDARGIRDGGPSAGADTKVPSSLSASGAQYNPKDFDLSAKGARFFVIKSFSEDDIHRSIKYSIWCSTEYGNKRLDVAWHEREGKGPVYLLFSVNGSGHFCGIAQMTSAVDYHSSSNVWAQDKWKGTFGVRWIFVKDVPNSQLRHIKLENNEGKPVTNSRDTQEVLPDKGRQVLSIIAQYRHTTSIFDDFGHYEKQLEESGCTEGDASTSGGDMNGSEDVVKSSSSPSASGNKSATSNGKVCKD